MQKITIKFIEHYGCYMAGEIAGFPAGMAQRLIDKGFAVEYESTRPAEAARLKNIAAAPETKHIPGPDQTMNVPGPEKTKTETTPTAPKTEAPKTKDLKPAGNKGRGGSKKKSGSKK